MSVDVNSYYHLPEWFPRLSLKKAVKSQLGSYDKILSIIPNLENMQKKNCIVLLPIKVRVMMHDQTVKRASFMLKTQNTTGYQSKILTKFKMFFREQQVYQHLLPKFRKFYKAAGKEVTFGPKQYKLDNKIGINYVLLEDLKTKNYRNVKRVEGFEMPQMKEVLKKLAEFHAASAVYVDRYGIFDKLFTVGVYTKSNKNILKELNDSGPFLLQLKRWSVGKKYYKKLENSDSVLVDRLIEDQKYKPEEFNVLNHCDCWINNVMFKCNSSGSVEDTKLIDYQVVKYGSPAYDLIFSILSSAHQEIKLEKFDYLVQFYFYFLLENLQLLQYRKELPELKNLQISLANNGLAAYCVVSKVLPIVMLDKLEDDTKESYQSKMKCAMYTNRKYQKAMAEILPWMESRGYLNWK